MGSTTGSARAGRRAREGKAGAKIRTEGVSVEHVTAWRCSECGAIAENPQALHHRPGTNRVCAGTASWVLGDWTKR